MPRTFRPQRCRPEDSNLSASDAVIACGDNRWGQLGLGYESNGLNSSISFVLEVRLNSIALVCGYPVKESLSTAVFYLDQNVSVKLGEKYIPSSNFRPWINRKYFNSECTILNDLPKGQHILTVKNSDEKRKSTLSHVISY